MDPYFSVFTRVFVVVVFAIPTVMRLLIASICRRIPSECPPVQELCENINFLGLNSIEFPFIFTCKDAVRYIQQLKQFDALGVWFEATFFVTMLLAFLVIFVGAFPSRNFRREVVPPGNGTSPFRQPSSSSSISPIQPRSLQLTRIPQA